MALRWSIARESEWMAGLTGEILKLCFYIIIVNSHTSTHGNGINTRNHGLIQIVERSFGKEWARKCPITAESVMILSVQKAHVHA